MAKYFFEPWVGKDYEQGWVLNGDKLEPAKKGGLKVMILGCDHYCKDVKSCGIHTKDKNGNEILSCNKQNDCKSYTKQVVNDVIKGTKYTSFINFQNAFCKKLGPEMWNHLLFSNFFQRGMPYENDRPKKNKPNSNQSFMTSYEKKCGTEAFVDIVKEHEPNIIIIWGGDAQGAIYDILKQNDLGFYLYLKNRPKIKIDTEDYPISFNILKNGNYSCLLIESYHPSSSSYKKYFNEERLSKILVYVFKNYTTIMNTLATYQGPLYVK